MTRLSRAPRALNISAGQRNSMEIQAAVRIQVLEHGIAPREALTDCAR